MFLRRKKTKNVKAGRRFINLCLERGCVKVWSFVGDALGDFDDKWCYRDAVCSLSEGEVLFAELLRCFVNSCVCIGVFPEGGRILA